MDEPGDYYDAGYDAQGRWVERKGNFIADDNAVIHWLMPEELERFANAQQTAEHLQDQAKEMVRKVLERELPGWQDGLDAEEDIVAVATAKELMGPEEAEQYGELLKGLGVAWSIQGDLMRVARERKGGPL